METKTPPRPVGLAKRVNHLEKMILDLGKKIDTKTTPDTADNSDLAQKITSLEQHLISIHKQLEADEKEVARLEHFGDTIAAIHTLLVEKGISSEDSINVVTELHNTVHTLTKQAVSIDERLKALEEKQIVPMDTSAIKSLQQKIEQLNGIKIEDNAVINLQEQIDALKMSISSEAPVNESDGDYIQFKNTALNDIRVLKEKTNTALETSQHVVSLSTQLENILEEVKLSSDTAASAEVRQHLNKLKEKTENLIDLQNKQYSLEQEFIRLNEEVRNSTANTDITGLTSRILDVESTSNQAVDMANNIKSVIDHMQDMLLKIKEDSDRRKTFDEKSSSNLNDQMKTILNSSKKLGTIVSRLDSRILKMENRLTTLEDLTDTEGGLSRKIEQLRKSQTKENIELKETLSTHENQIADLFRLQQKLLAHQDSVMKRIHNFAEEFSTIQNAAESSMGKVDSRMGTYDKNLHILRADVDDIKLNLGTAATISTDLEELKKDIIRLRVYQRKMGETVKALKKNISMVIE